MNLRLNFLAVVVLGGFSASVQAQPKPSEVHTDDDGRRIGELAIAASSLELVDNQITVGQPLGSL